LRAVKLTLPLDVLKLRYGEIYCGPVAWYEPTTCPLPSYRSNLYGFPAVHAWVRVKTAVFPAEIDVLLPELHVATAALFTFIEAMVTVFVPVFLTLSVMEAPPVTKVTLLMLIEDDPMNPTVKAPIHAATAMLTATVTAMSMIDATTGLRAFAFFLIFLSVFIFSFYPSFGIDEYVRGVYQFKSYDLIHNIIYV
jgi:hypothetical protein